ncbi:MAG: hypothetical protein OES20_17185 [Gammaproteobacteria bacterium]|nr:hypothetical protein [Gammaproteobacteria bacterium]MDH3856682.1 hypothetical protein [Gammaproteobacteria bacterium]
MEKSIISCRLFSSGVDLGRIAALAACIFLLVGCGITNSPKQLRPPVSVTPTAIVKDSIMIHQPQGDGPGFGCRSWAGSKFYLYEKQFGEVLANWLAQSGLTLVQQGTAARYSLESRASKPDIIYVPKDWQIIRPDSHPFTMINYLPKIYPPKGWKISKNVGRFTDITYLLKDRQNGETVWQLTEPWPYQIQPNVCREKAMDHFATVASALASWDGTPGKVIDKSEIALGAAAFHRRVLRPSDPDTPLGELEAELEKRYASGEVSPVDIIDPHFELVKCEGLSQDTAPIYIALGAGFPSVACENTVAGQRLLMRRRWECSPEPTRNCVCGGRWKGSFPYLFDSPDFQSGSIYSKIDLGDLWDGFGVDPDKLTTWLLGQGPRMRLTPCSFDE